MMKILVIDDEPLARSIVKEYLQSYPQLQIVKECQDGFEGIKAIMEYKPDLVFLDIQLPKINGFEMLELVEQPPAIIFTTAFDEYAIRAFETHAIDYLLKPFSRERFDKAIRKWQESQGATVPPATNPLLDMAAHSPAQSQRVVVKTGGKIKIIPVNEIHYIEAADDFVRLHTAEGFFLKNKTMNYFETLLDAQQFVRTHRSFIVNIHQVTRIDPYEKDNQVAVLRGGQKLPVSKTGYARLREVLGL